MTAPVCAGIDPETMRYPAGHENGRVPIDIYTKAGYKKREELSSFGYFDPIC